MRGKEQSNCPCTVSHAISIAIAIPSSISIAISVAMAIAKARSYFSYRSSIISAALISQETTVMPSAKMPSVTKSSTQDGR